MNFIIGMSCFYCRRGTKENILIFRKWEKEEGLIVTFTLSKHLHYTIVRAENIFDRSVANQMPRLLMKLKESEELKSSERQSITTQTFRNFAVTFKNCMKRKSRCSFQSQLILPSASSCFLLTFKETFFTHPIERINRFQALKYEKP